jgi:hypothetical protein
MSTPIRSQLSPPAALLAALLVGGCAPPADVTAPPPRAEPEPGDPLPEATPEAPSEETAAETSEAYVVPPRAEEETPGKYDDFVDEVFIAFKSENYDKIRKYRKKLSDPRVDEFVHHWDKKLPWEVKNGFVHLLVGYSYAGVERIMRDGLTSPTLHIRATALVHLAGSEDERKELLGPDGELSEAKVAAAVEHLQP